MSFKRKLRRAEIIDLKKRRDEAQLEKARGGPLCYAMDSYLEMKIPKRPFLRAVNLQDPKK